MKTVFILVEPAVAGNIGSAARAIKVMGFRELWLVNPTNHLAEEAQWLAHASGEILENARIFNTLQEAAAETDLLVATSAKNRSTHQDFIKGATLKAFAEKKQPLINTLGIVFGREESGLTSSEMLLCDVATSVPMATTYPSLNLSQAVMLYAFLMQTTPEEQEHEIKQDNAPGFRRVKNNIMEIIKAAGFSNKHPILQRINERLSALSGKDMNLVHSVAMKIKEKYLRDNP